MRKLAIALRVLAGVLGFGGLSLILFAPAFEWNPKIVAPAMIMLFILAGICFLSSESISDQLDAEVPDRPNKEKYKCAYCRSDSDHGKGKCSNCGSEVYIKIEDDL